MVKLKKSSEHKNKKENLSTKNNDKLKKHRKEKKNSKIKTRVKKKIKKSLMISPFHFQKENNFYYEIKNINYFFRYVNNPNDFKPNLTEIEILQKKIRDIRIVNDYQYDKLINVTPYFYSKIISLEKTPFSYDIKDKNINQIINNYNKNHSISLTKIKEIFNTETGDKISLTSLNRRIKNNLNFSYKKITLKPKELDNKYYKMMSFFFIKLIIRVIKLGLYPIFIDESKFTLKNENFKTWVNQDDFYHYGTKKNDKKNIILAVGTSKVFHYELTDLNTSGIVFKKFMIRLINKINDIQNYFLIMDNLSVHLTNEIKTLVNKFNLKLIYTVPYESTFNPIELAFRFIKNKIYRHSYFTMNDMKNDIETIIKSIEFENSLEKNWAETMEKYLIFINNNNNVNLNTLD